MQKGKQIRLFRGFEFSLHKYVAKQSLHKYVAKHKSVAHFLQCFGFHFLELIHWDVSAILHR